MRTQTRAMATALLLVACAARQRHDEMSAAEHRQAAAHERAVADAYATMSPVYGAAPSSGPGGVPGHAGFSDRQGGSRAEVFDHLSHAAQHEALADAIEAFAATECANVPAGARAACPLVPVIAVEDVADGARLHLRAGAPLDEIVARMRCHLAFARASGQLRSPSCPLYIGGVEIVRAPVADAIDLVAHDRAARDEIRRRAHAYAR